VDSAFSLEPEEFKLLSTETERAFLSLGKIQLGVQEAEKKSLTFKRSLYAISEIKEGELFTKKNIASKRPALGLHTKFIDVVIGKKATKNIMSGTPIQWDLLM
jgi:N-acetylneuraminate synthase